jgi:fructokinase
VIFFESQHLYDRTEIVHRLVRGGWPRDVREWDDLVGFAMDVAALVCARPGGATAMPTLAQVGR